MWEFPSGFRANFHLQHPASSRAADATITAKRVHSSLKLSHLLSACGWETAWTGNCNFVFNSPWWTFLTFILLVIFERLCLSGYCSVLHKWTPWFNYMLCKGKGTVSFKPASRRQWLHIYVCEFLYIDVHKHMYSQSLCIICLLKADLFVCGICQKNNCQIKSN